VLFLLTFLIMASPTTTPEIVVVFTGPDDTVLSGQRIKVGLPSGEMLLTTDKNGTIRFRTGSSVAVFAFFEAGDKTWTALPTTYELKPEQDRFDISIKLKHDPRGGGP